jgi:transposase
MKLTAGISYEEVKEAYNKEKDGRIKQRLLIILKAFKIKSSYKIAELIDTSHTKVQRWINRFNKYGFKGLKDKKRSGRPTQLTEEQKKRLENILDNPGELKPGFKTNEIVERIKKVFRVVYTVRHVRRLLHSMGYGRIKGRPEHVNKDPIKAKSVIRKLKKNFYVWSKVDGHHLQEMNSV